GSALDWPNSISGMALAAPTLAPGETPVNLQNGAPPWPACAPAVERPAAVLPQFPADLPLPPGLLLFKSLSLHGNANNIQLVGYAPIPFGSAVRFVVDRLPAAGYNLGRGDSEGITEAESTFTGPGWTGGVRIASLMDCEAVTEWVIIVTKR
ncbi:MAG: hypothetical protein ABI847_17335, partial [Anaerolineales bacterium]